MQWTGRLRSVVSGVVLTAVVGAGCSSIQSSATPPSQTIDLTGTWRGNFAVQAVTSEMVWTLTQSGTSVSGPVLVRLPNGVVLLNGFLTGTLSGSSLAYTISVGQQGNPDAAGVRRTAWRHDDGADRHHLHAHGRIHGDLHDVHTALRLERRPLADALNVRQVSCGASAPAVSGRPEGLHDHYFSEMPAAMMNSVVRGLPGAGGIGVPSRIS